MLVRKQAKTVIFLNLLYYKKSFDNDKENITLLIFYLQQQYKNNNNEWTLEYNDSLGRLWHHVLRR